MVMNLTGWEDVIARMSEYRHNVWHWEEYCFCFYTTISEPMAYHVIDCHIRNEAH